MLGVLKRYDVDFVVIGGMAGIALGSALPSFDLDIAYGRDRENLERLVSALRELSATLRGAPADAPFQLDAKTIENGAHFTFETRFGSLDILSDPAGAPRYAQLKAAAEDRELAGEHVSVASIDHLIAMKEASGRAKDKYMAMEYRSLSDKLRATRNDPPASETRSRN